MAEQPWRLYVDVEITRRKRYHLVASPEGEIVFRSRIVSEVIGYLVDHEISCYRLVTPVQSYEVKYELSAEA